MKYLTVMVRPMVVSDRMGQSTQLVSIGSGLAAGFELFGVVLPVAMADELYRDHLWKASLLDFVNRQGVARMMGPLSVQVETVLSGPPTNALAQNIIEVRADGCSIGIKESVGS